jgi:hypothetical protein
MVKSLPLGLAQEKFERDRFVPQTALCVEFFVARLRAHTQISDLDPSPRSSTRFTRAMRAHLGRRYLTTHHTSPHATRNRTKMKVQFLRRRRRTWRLSAFGKRSDNQARPSRA